MAEFALFVTRLTSIREFLSRYRLNLSDRDYCTNSKFAGFQESTSQRDIFLSTYLKYAQSFQLLREAKRNQHHEKLYHNGGIFAFSTRTATFCEELYVKNSAPSIFFSDNRLASSKELFCPIYLQWRRSLDSILIYMDDWSRPIMANEAKTK